MHRLGYIKWVGYIKWDWVRYWIPSKARGSLKMRPIEPVCKPSLKIVATGRYRHGIVAAISPSRLFKRSVGDPA
ncbi:hypothetical protein BC443_04975 [Salinicola sp. MIT1003]|nr:hypothetical protein BC443_04975 [Salinicola sp. MIT1003]